MTHPAKPAAARELAEAVRALLDRLDEMFIGPTTADHLTAVAAALSRFDSAPESTPAGFVATRIVNAVTNFVDHSRKTNVSRVMVLEGLVDELRAALKAAHEGGSTRGT